MEEHGYLSDEDYIDVLVTSRSVSEAARRAGRSRTRMNQKILELTSKGLIERGSVYRRTSRED